jgi:hypothetical protein
MQEAGNLRLVEPVPVNEDALLTDAVMSLSALLAIWPVNDGLWAAVAGLCEALGSRLGGLAG